MGLDTDAADALRAACGGALHLPGEPGYDAGRRVWHDICDQRPAAVGYPADAEEVAAVMRIAAAAGLRVAPQLTGRKAAALGALDDVILLRLAGLRGVKVDSTQHLAHIGAGVLWLDLVGAGARQGVAAPHPWGCDVGVVGHCLDAGTGPYARLLGLAAGALVGAEVVMPDGQLHRLTATTDEDMLWLLRGGGGVGVVTALDLQLCPIPRVYAGSLQWPGVQALHVLERWVEWCASAPDEATTRFRLVADPTDASGACVTIEGLIVADEATAVRTLAGLRAAGPALDTFAVHSTDEAAALFSSSFTSVPELTFVSALPSTAREVLVDRPVDDIEIRHLGAATARASRYEGARTCFDGEFSVVTTDKDVHDALRPWALSERWASEVETRLSSLRSRIDPAGLLVSAPVGG